MDLSRVLKFLRELSKHNDRDWFNAHKEQYLDAKENFEQFVDASIRELTKFDESLGNLEARKITFRIYRDVRFSKDKRPYKTNMGAGYSQNGKLVQEPGYYLHIEPGNKSFVAGGIYMPDPSNLSKIRQEIDYNGKVLEKIVRQKKFKSTFPDFDDLDKLKTVPKGYAKDHPYIEWLKLKSLIVSKTFKDNEVTDKSFLKNVANTCNTIKPLNDFLKEALGS